MAFFPSPGRPSLRRPRARRRDERGVAFPSPLVMLSVLAVAMAAITFVATRSEAPTERRVDTATIASADRTPEVHENNLTDLDAKYADVIDLREALDHL